jgi:hypothetical protein
MLFENNYVEVKQLFKMGENIILKFSKISYLQVFKKWDI